MVLPAIENGQTHLAEFHTQAALHPASGGFYISPILQMKKLESGEFK